MTKRRSYVGKNNPCWRGGKTIRNGYIYVYCPDHPHATKTKCVLEHHLIMEQHLGRYLKPNQLEVVHHINGIKTDNRIENLELFSSETEHQNKHPKKRNNKGQFERSLL